ncbi:uncharacterized protein EV420DRAFT_1582093 [Desarmillaria tabescens]|uniref:Uncharacterized protein n=1 Tax=Armillaria tabescens TaxID=1929756 RepID=A0AA39MNR9_ARMTA|nr:uncharacterized protein EV420DRAFT_1582093 [Desarmillaria tabescens]KAK0440195.1 hypothetical protein EV420DRAFT_1582093 [Desarmillaria tabescens]
MYQIFMIFLTLLCITRASEVEISPDGRDGVPVCFEDRRTILSIVWSCLATIFACTWLAVHPNVPGRNITTKGSISCAIERVKIMVVAILAPEVIVAWAAEQFMVAWRLCHGMDISISSVIRAWRGKKADDAPGPTRGETEDDSPDLTMSHGFFLSMGGFFYTKIRYTERSADDSRSYRMHSNLHFPGGPSDRRTVHKVEKRLLTLRDLKNQPDLMKKLNAVRVETIEDKSKGDALSKTFSILQISWFIAQCIGRSIQYLPITLLEMTALAFAGLSMITYCLWWYKPLNVKYHISLDGPNAKKLQPTPETDPLHRILAEPSALGLVLRTILGFAVTDDCLWDIDMYKDITYGAFRFSSGTSNQSWSRFVILACVGSLFGAFHCAAWSFYFPSPTEMMLWRVSSLAVLIGLLAAVHYPGATLITEGQRPGWMSKVPQILPHSWTDSRIWNLFLWVCVVILSSVGAVAYIIARIMLIVLAFMQLRSLPPLAFHTVQWTTYIPHI